MFTVIAITLCVYRVLGRFTALKAIKHAPPIVRGKAPVIKAKKTSNTRAGSTTTIDELENSYEENLQMLKAEQQTS